MERRKILVAAEREILEATEHAFFRRVHYDLLLVNDGAEAFSAIEEQDPVLAILGLEMPILTGDACCRRVKDDPLLRGTPIILVAPSDAGEDLERCRQSGCDAVALSPIDRQELVATACRLLGIGERTEPRPAVDIANRYGSSPEDLSPGRAVNLNSGGMFIATSRLLPIDTRVTVAFSLPGDPEESRLQGRIAWVNHPEWMKTPRLPVGMGIHFLELSPEKRRAILDFLAELNNDHGERMESGDESAEG